MCSIFFGITCETKTRSVDTIKNNINNSISHKDTISFLINDLVNKPFTKQLKISDLTDESFIAIKTIQIKNTHDKDKIDTILTFKKGNSTFEFYKTDEKQILINFYIENNFSLLKKDIQIQSKKLLYKGKNIITQKNQIIVIHEEEEMGLLLLNIVNGKIYSITGNYVCD